MSLRTGGRSECKEHSCCGSMAGTGMFFFGLTRRRVQYILFKNKWSFIIQYMYKAGFRENMGMKIKHEKTTEYAKKIIPFIGGTCFVLSLNHIISLFGIQGGFAGVGEFGYNIWSLLGFGAALGLMGRMLRRRDRRLHVTAAISGLLMSAAIVYGTYAHFVNDIFQSAQAVWMQFAVMAGLLAVTVPASEEILLQFDRLNRYGERKWEGKVRKGYFFLVWALIFAAYIPIFLWFWPGNFVYDAPFQMAEVVSEQYNTHHPLLHTSLMGLAYNYGRSVEDASSGFQFYSLLQMLVLSDSFAYCVYYLYKRRVPRVYRVCTLLFFALFPMHAMFSITATKDVMFAAFFLWFMIFVVRLLADKEEFHWYSSVGIILSGTLCCLMRNNAVYAVTAGAVILLALVKRTGRQKVFGAALLAGICALSFLAEAGLKAAVHAETDDRYRETFCMPLQCLARVASYRAEDVEQTDYEEICMYMVEEDIKNYSPYLADSVKSTANEELMRDNFWNFLKLFVKMGLKFPDEYMEAWITNTMGYWYPLDRGYVASGAIEFYHKLIWTEYEIVKRNYCSWPAVIYEPLYFHMEYSKVPILGYLHRPDFWIWFLTYFLFWSIYRKKRDAGLTGLIPLMYLGTCYLGPVSVLRYVYCLVVTAPLIGYVVLVSGGSCEAHENTEEGIESAERVTEAGEEG